MTQHAIRLQWQASSAVVAITPFRSSWSSLLRSCSSAISAFASWAEPDPVLPAPFHDLSARVPATPTTYRRDRRATGPSGWNAGGHPLLGPGGTLSSVGTSP